MKNFLILIANLLAFGATQAQNNVHIDCLNGKDTINKNIYGHFAEHLGRCIYGGFYVGKDETRIPNKNGLRLDIVEALRKLKTPVLRWPGGCYADNYHWKDGIGPQQTRKHTENMSWGNVREDNSFGTNEFLELCELINAEPYLAVNMGSGTVQEAAEWVQYVNHPNGTSYLTDMREQSGRKTAWDVKYWGVGNESWDCGGHMTADYYANEYKKYATFMTSYSNTEGLFRIAVGPGTEDFNWTETLMKQIPLKMIEGLSIHHYSVINWEKKGHAVFYNEEEYFKTIKQAYRMESMISGNAAVMDKYDPAKKIALIVDEWGGWYESDATVKGGILYQQNTMRDAMIAGLTLNTFHHHADRVRMANLAQCVNVLQAVILTSGEKMIITPTYHVMEMYNVHQGAVSLPVQVQSKNYTLGSDSVQAVNASASKDKEGYIHISLVNVDARQTQPVRISLSGGQYSVVSGRILQSKNLQDCNTFERPDSVKPSSFDGIKLSDNQINLALPPFSVVVLKIK